MSMRVTACRAAKVSSQCLSNPITVMPNARARTVISRPIRPRPMIPMVLPINS